MATAGIQYREYAPDPRLAVLVECYWDVLDPAPRLNREAERIVPDACPEIIIHQADPFRRLIGARWVPQRRMFLAGTLSRPWRLKPGGRIDTVGIRFRPGAITRLFPIDMIGAADRETPLDAIVGASTARVLKRDLVAAELGISRRRLERLFARDLGIRPKLFARIVRLNAALARLDVGEREAAVDVALGAGYFDQAHMSRDFRAVAGRSPRAPVAGR